MPATVASRCGGGLAAPTGWNECQPATLTQGGSKIFDPETGEIKRIKSFSRVGYQFGRDLQNKLGVPVGMIQASLGGSIIASWIPRQSSEREFPYGQNMPISQGAIKRHPGALYHLLVRPLTRMSVRGVIWYQGESDADNMEYEQQLKQLITSWRDAFGDPDMPFHMVQISASSFRGGMLGVWEAQRRSRALTTRPPGRCRARRIRTRRIITSSPGAWRISASARCMEGPTGKPAVPCTSPTGSRVTRSSSSSTTSVRA